MRGSEEKAQWGKVDALVPQLATQDGRDAYFAQRLDENPEIMYRILGDIYDEVVAREARARGVVKMGRRPKRDVVPLKEFFAKAIPDSVSHKPFREALADLMGEETQRAFASRIPISQPALWRLLNGERAPDLQLMERIAAAGGVHPQYFVEWRAMFVGKLIEDVLLTDSRRSLGVIQVLRRRLESRA